MTALTNPKASEKNPTWVTCGACGHTWTGIILPMPISDAARVLKNLTCPNCAAGSDRIRISNTDPRIIRKS